MNKVNKKESKIQKRVSEFCVKQIELQKALNLLLKYNGRKDFVSHSAYSSAHLALSESYKDVATEIKKRWNEEYEKAQKTGDYNRLIHLPVISDRLHGA